MSCMLTGDTRLLGQRQRCCTHSPASSVHISIFVLVLPHCQLPVGWYDGLTGKLHMLKVWVSAEEHWAWGIHCFGSKQLESLYLTEGKKSPYPSTLLSINTALRNVPGKRAIRALWSWHTNQGGLYLPTKTEHWLVGAEVGKGWLQ